jgi:hemerythrin-like domain-containing protein
MGMAEAVIGGFQPELLTDPCAFLLAEHGRHRAMLGHLERMARLQHGPARPAVARVLVAWLACELPLHLADEAQSVMPRLAAAAPALAIRLEAEEAGLSDLRQKTREVLVPIAAGRPPGEDFAATALAFVQLYRQRLATEEAELLPMARRVLDAPACHAIATEMRQRRS